MEEDRYTFSGPTFFSFFWMEVGIMVSFISTEISTLTIQFYIHSFPIPNKDLFNNPLLLILFSPSPIFSLDFLPQ